MDLIKNIFLSIENLSLKTNRLLFAAIIFFLSFLWKAQGVSAQSSRLWATYYGGTNEDGTSGVATDPVGNVYLAGTTQSTTSIASGGFQNIIGGGYDAFLVKLDASGNRLWATYYGNSGFELGKCVATDKKGNVYLGGVTNSSSGIASGGFQNTKAGGGNNAFLVKFDGSGNRLWATYYGGIGGNEEASSIATDTSGNVYLAGFTGGSAGLASAGFQNIYGGGVRDAFLVKFDANGNRKWATYYGGSVMEADSRVETDLKGNVYLAGNTNSTSGIASGGFQNIYGGGGASDYDSFLVKFDSLGTRLWATYYGGTGNEYYIGSIATDAVGSVYLAGTTSSTSGIASGGFQNVYGGPSDHFLVKFNGSGNRLWATYYGGTGNEDGQGSKYLATDAAGNVYLAGETYSFTNIASGGFQNTLAGIGPITDPRENAFLVKFDSMGNRLCATYYGINHEESSNIAIDGSGNVYLAGSTPDSLGKAYSMPLSSGGFQNNYGGGFYDAYVVKFTSCSSILSVSVSSTDANCNGNCNGSATAIPSGGSGSYFYSWNTTPIQTTQTITGLCAGTYTVIVTDALNATAATTMTISTLYTFTVTASGNTTIQNGGSTTLNVSGGIYYQWNPIGGLNCTTCQNPTVSPTATTIYCVTVTDMNGCIDSTCVTVNVEIKCGELFIPTAFSPNADNNNDCFRVYATIGCFKTFYLAIYDRWGEKIFSTHDPVSCWEGIYKNKELKTDIFVYYLQAITLRDEEINERGNISLIR